jgi:hypothetical protein
VSLRPWHRMSSQQTNNYRRNCRQAPRGCRRSVNPFQPHLHILTQLSSPWSPPFINEPGTQF